MKFDAQGFLVGDKIAMNNGGASPAIAVLGAVRRDVSVIRRLLESGVGRRGSGSPVRSARDDGVGSTVRASVAATVRREFAAQSVRARSEAAVTPMARDARGRFMRSAQASATGVGAAKVAGSATVATPAGRSKMAGRAVVSDSAVSEQRDARGRFTSGGSSGGATDAAGSDTLGRIASTLDNISGAVTGVENIDPTIAALKEVREAVSPLGRGFMALQSRMAERKKERWYSRILKAITGRKGETVSGGGDVTRGSFLGTFLGESVGSLVGRLPAMLGTLLTRVFAPVAAAWAAWEVGQWIGGKINDWLEKSGIAGKIIDAFIGVTDWLKQKGGQFSAGMASQRSPAGVGKLPPATSFAEKAGRFVGAVGSLFDRSKSTGTAYAAGNIEGLNDAQTRALVASTVMTESGGGRTDVVNSAGYMGRYQAGASWLADAGLIRGGASAVSQAMAKDGFKNEYKWGQSGGMTRFLKDPANWNKGLSYEAYLASPEVQDLAFRDNSSAAYRSLLASGAINKSTPMNVVAGALKARHIAGMRGAQTVLAGGTGAADANGTTALKYFQDVAHDRHGFGAAFSSTVATPKVPAIPSPVPERPASAQAPTIPEKLGGSQRPQVAVISKEAAGRDMRDRRLSNIATGGIGG